jgi:DNA transformation protein
MAASQAYFAYVLEQLGALEGLASRRMFGGWGLYCDGRFFAVIFKDTLYFKTDESTRGEFETRGMRRFRPFPDRPQAGGGSGYFELPAEVLEDPEACVAWARRAVAAAAKPKATRARKTRLTRAAKPRRARL